jgi:hypothetical protein
MKLISILFFELQIYIGINVKSIMGLLNINHFLISEVITMTAWLA